MPEDLKVSQIVSSPLPPPFRGLHSLGVRKYCQIIFACYFRKRLLGTRVDDWNLITAIDCEPDPGGKHDDLLSNARFLLLLL